MLYFWGESAALYSADGSHVPPPWKFLLLKSITFIYLYWPRRTHANVYPTTCDAPDPMRLYNDACARTHCMTSCCVRWCQKMCVRFILRICTPDTLPIGPGVTIMAWGRCLCAAPLEVPSVKFNHFLLLILASTKTRRRIPYELRCS